MNSSARHTHICCDLGPLQESRSVRFNLPVVGPSRWRLLGELLFSAPDRIFRYRHASNRMLENAIRTMNRENCQ
mgnify:CR=1 FL=1